MIGISLPFIAQSPEEITQPTLVEQDNGHDVLLLPHSHIAQTGSWDFEDTRIDIVRYEERVLFTASSGAKKVSQWISRVDGIGQFAFDVRSKKFRPILNSVRIRLDNYRELDSLIKLTDAESGKSFPDVDFAIIYLRPNQDIRQYFNLIRQQPGVKSVKLMFQMPSNVPM